LLGFSICATSDAVLRSAIDAGHAGSPALQERGRAEMTAAIAQSDGFVFVTPSTLRPLRVLKNAIDWVYPEWNRKAAGFVSYGSAMGARSVQQLRANGDRDSARRFAHRLHIPVATLWAHYTDGDVDAGLASWRRLRGADRRSLWWTAALKRPRARAASK